jgi:hypothetical protein
VLKLRHYAAPMVEICEELQRLDFPFIDKKMRPYFRDVADPRHTAAAGRPQLAARHRQPDHRGRPAAGVIEAERGAAQVRRLGGDPGLPTAVAGIYGMNFQNMPELHWHYGYFLVMGLLIIACVGSTSASSRPIGCERAPETQMPLGRAAFAGRLRLQAALLRPVRQAHHPLGHRGALVMRTPGFHAFR